MCTTKVKKVCHVCFSLLILSTYILGFVLLWDYTHEPAYMLVYAIFGFWLGLGLVVYLYISLGIGEEDERNGEYGNITDRDVYSPSAHVLTGYAPTDPQKEGEYSPSRAEGEISTTVKNEK